MSDKSTQTTQPAQKKSLSKSLKYLFGVGDGAFTLMTNVETYYFMSVLTAGFAPFIAGLINTIFTTVDALLSWIYGGILNGTKAKKFGRYRSWLVLTPWIVPFLYAFQFLKLGDNEIVSAVIIIAAAIISHVVWNIGYVANVTLISVVGKNPDEKAILSSSRAFWASASNVLFSYLGLPLATLLAAYVGERNQWAATAFCLGVLMAVGYYAHFRMTKGYEQIETDATPKSQSQKITIREMFKSLFQNPQLLILMLADLAKWCVKFVAGAAAIYYFRDAMQNPGYMGGYLLATGLASMVGSFVMRYMAKLFSSRTTMIISYVGMAAFLVGIYFGYASAPLVIGLMTGAQFFYGVSYAASPALYADTVVYATYKTGKNAAGWIMGLQNLPLKVGVILRGLILPAVLVSVGWFDGVAYEGVARQSMTIAFALVPAIFCVIGMLLLVFGYKLTKKKVLEYQAAIDAR